MRIATLALAAGAFLASAASAQTAQTLPFTQNWTNTGLITTNDDWSGVPGIVGYLGDIDAAGAVTNVDPRTLLADYAPGNTPASAVDVIANQAVTTVTSGGVAEFEITDPVVALQGSGTADAPHLVIHLNATGQSNIRFQANLRDVDGGTEDAAQQIAIQYRVGTTGAYVNAPGGYFADVTTAATATQVTPVDITLPADADNAADLFIRIMTTNAVGSDEWVGIDDISVTTGTVTPPTGQTIAEARAAGVGQSVMVRGTVSRTMGAFTYFQDATAGLTIRQTSGAFFDAIVAGDIRPGTVIDVTGTLSEFRQLLQINQPNATTNDLASCTIVSQGAAPAAQAVDLATLQASGESYEAELVAVSGVTITGAGTFTPATSYPISDASASASSVVLRVPNANDTEIDGQAIPTVPALFTAVVGQFDTANPTGGYQLLVIKDGDVSTVVATAPGAANSGLSLFAGSPVSGTTAVRYALATAGNVRLAVYDVLGREVAVLAEGARTAGENVATLEAGRLATGAYVLRLQAGDAAVTRLVTVAR